MARYFMHLSDGTEQILDPEGLEFASVEALRKSVLLAARDLMSGDIREGILDFRFRIDAEDERGVIIYSLPFKHAVNIIPEFIPLPEAA
ncbi:MAG: hypothetical protein ABIO69_08590 [Sphingomicrobium sp.]